jgi:hypothetical protein
MRAEDEPPFAPRVTAMALAEPPPPGPPEVVARAVESLEELEAAADISATAFRMTDEQRAAGKADVPRRWAARHEPGVPEPFLAWLGGRPVATGFSVHGPKGALLIGGSTLPDARGRGAYRALVRARWDAAAARGTPLLVVEAVAMSRAILERLGFTPLGEIDILVDRL